MSDRGHILFVLVNDPTVPDRTDAFSEGRDEEGLAVSCAVWLGSRQQALRSWLFPVTPHTIGRIFWKRRQTSN